MIYKTVKSQPIMTVVGSEGKSNYFTFFWHMKEDYKICGIQENLNVQFSADLRRRGDVYNLKFGKFGH